MTNNLEDFEQPDPGQGGLPPAQGTRGKLMHAWRTRPIFKLLVVMIIAAALIVVGMSLFSGTTQTEQARVLAPPKGFKEAPGGANSPYFADQTIKAQTDREKTALSTGGSALPTPMGNSNALEEVNPNDKPKKDPLVELRSQIAQQKQQIDQMKQSQDQQQQQTVAAAKPPEQFDNSLAQAMQKQMKDLMNSWEAKGIKAVNGYGEREVSGSGSKQAGGSLVDESGALVRQNSGPKIRTFVPAGTVSYAQLLTEANSDVPGPILAQIVSGPLSGARAVGSFKVMNDLLILKFNLANLKGKDYMIDTLALDPDTTLGGMATEVDQRFFTRVLLPAAAGFMQGFGNALSTPSSSIVTNGSTTIVQQSGQGVEQGLFQGLAQAGQTVGQFFQNQANKTKPLVRVAAGTPMGLFFVRSVTSKDSTEFAQQYGSQQRPPASGFGYPQTYTGQTGIMPGSGYGGYYPGVSPAGYGGAEGQYGGVGGTTGADSGSSTGTSATSSDQPYNPSLPPVQNRGIGTYPGGGIGYGGTPYYGSPTP